MKSYYEVEEERNEEDEKQGNPLRGTKKILVALKALLIHMN